MQYKKLNNMNVPVIGQGTGGIRDEKIIKLGIEHGMTFIDTAESYGNEQIIGQAIKGKRDKVFISTKFSPEHNGYEDVIKSCGGSLKRLDTDYIDLYSMYYPNPKIEIGETLNALSKLSNSGKVKSVGVCNVYGESLKAFNTLGIDAVQLEYNLFERGIEKILPYCEEHNILTVAYSPLKGFHDLNPDAMIWLQEIASKYEKTLSQVILNWLISHKTVIVIPRSNNQQHVIKNSQASDFTLTEEDLKEIDKLFPYEVSYIDPKLIDITRDADRYPQTKEQAMTFEKWAVKPQDLDLDDFKPVKIMPAEKGTYQIIEGGLRYWAWVIQKTEPIPVLIKQRYIL